jgi:hypothetical protein
VSRSSSCGSLAFLPCREASNNSCRASTCEYSGFLNFTRLVQRTSVLYDPFALAYNAFEIKRARSAIEIASALPYPRHPTAPRWRKDGRV